MWKSKFIQMLLVISILQMGTMAQAEEKTEEYKQSWPVGSVETLEIVNKFGEVVINDDGGSEVTIEVEVTVDAANEKRANEFLDKIDIVFSKSGKKAKAVTSIEKSFKSQSKFSIDYKVNIPSDKNLIISNKYGNTVVNELKANGEFDIQYGNITANELVAPESGKMNLNLSYGKGSIGTTGNMEITIKYSNLVLEETGIVSLNSKYSVVEAEEAQAIKIESKYDKFSFSEVESVKATMKYTHIKIGELSKRLIVDAGYGGVRVSQVSPEFEEISITNSYGQIALGMDNAGYSIDASCEYCGISYPEDSFSGNKMKEKYTQILEGQVGSGGGTIMVRSRYGDIKLSD